MKYLVLGSLMLISSRAEAVEWPSLEAPPYQDQIAPKDRVLIISLEDYAYLSDIRNASQNALEWKNYFLETLGVPSKNIILLENENATRNKIKQAVSKSSKKLSRQGRLWIIYIGHGATSFKGDSGLILPYHTESTAKSVYENGLSLETIQELNDPANSRTIAIFDCSFNGKDRSGAPIVSNMPIQDGILPKMGEATIVQAAKIGETARLNDGNYRPGLSYLLLGGLRGWAEEDQDGWVSLEEASNYADRILDAQSIHVAGTYRKQKISEAKEKGPPLVVVDPEIKAKEPVDYIPVGMLAENVSLNDLLNELKQQRTFEVEVEKLMNEQVSAIRIEASKAWKEVRRFAQDRADDPAKVAVYAFLREYEDKEINVRGQKMLVDIPEVSQARSLLLQLATPSVLGTDFAWIKDGSFLMGNANGAADASIVRTIKLTHSFYISTTEIPQKLYQAILNENPSSVKADALPVTNVSWYDAVRFANALSAYEGFEECYQIKGEEVLFPKGVDCLGYRLPTEAEWEYAARAKSKYVFSGGNRLSKLAWTVDNSGDESHYIGQKLPNAFGLYDMSGNVWEWCWDQYDTYDPSQTIDPLGAQDGQYRVRRGGSYQQEVNYARVDTRYSVHPNYRSPEQGFRLVRTAPEL